MSVDNNKIKINAVAKIEKYPPGTTKEDIEQGLVKPEEILVSEDVLLNPNLEVLNQLKELGMKIPKEIWDKASQ
jgi:hypothetical protein